MHVTAELLFQDGAKADTATHYKYKCTHIHTHTHKCEWAYIFLSHRDLVSQNVVDGVVVLDLDLSITSKETCIILLPHMVRKACMDGYVLQSHGTSIALSKESILLYLDRNMGARCLRREIKG